MFDFLLRYMVPTNWSLPDAMGINPDDPVESDRCLLLSPETSVNETHDEPDHNEVQPSCETDTTCLSGPPFNGNTTLYEDSFQMAASHLGILGMLPMSIYDRLAHGIIDELVCFLDQQSTCQSDDMDVMCQFLLSGGLEDHLASYFTRWHRHSPTIHRPTFRLSTTSYPLLLAIFLVGASICSTAETRRLVKKILGLAEHYIFENRYFLSLLTTDPKDAFVNQCLHAVQAAHCIVQLQLRSESNAKRNSIRHHRFQQLITSIQNYNAMYRYQGAEINTAFDTSGQSSWRNFGAMEATKRLTCGIFTLEASFNILYDIVPRLKLEDLNISLPCSVEEFMIGSQSSILYSSDSEKMNFELQKALDSLFAKQKDFGKLRFYRFDVLHLFILILGKLTSAHVPIY